MRGHETLVLPEDTITDTVLALGTYLRQTGEGAGSASDGALDWLKVSPLMVHSNIEPKLRRTSLDDAIDDCLSSLEDVCHRPVDRLRTVHRLVPVGAARRILPATITRLAGHSEDWNRLRPDTVEPKVVLSQFRDPYADFYENRVAARLVDNLWQEVSRRLHTVSAIEIGAASINKYVAQAAGRPYRMQGSLFQMIVDTPFDQAWQDRVGARRAELARVLDRIESLRGSRVLPGVDRHAAIGTALRVTNLFVSEHRYRRVRDLWHAWVADHTGANQEADGQARAQEFAKAFTAYTALLLLHALDHLAVTVGKEVQLAPGRTLRLQGMATSLTWSPSGTLDVGTDAGLLLRVIPLPQALTRKDRTVAGAAELAKLTAARPLDVPTLVVYPGSAAERAELPSPARLAYFSGIESMAPGASGYGVLPVSPVELDSVLRLARNIRLAAEYERTMSYPIPISASASHANALTADWLPKAERGLEVIKPPTPAEQDRAMTALDGLRTRARGQAHLRGELKPLDRLEATVRAAANKTEGFTTCPVCGRERPDPWRAFHPRSDDGTYDCDKCQNCGARWEIRRCKSCEKPYPVLRPDPALKPGTSTATRSTRSLAASYSPSRAGCGRQHVSAHRAGHVPRLSRGTRPDAVAAAAQAVEVTPSYQDRVHRGRHRTDRMRLVRGLPTCPTAAPTSACRVGHSRRLRRHLERRRCTPEHRPPLNTTTFALPGFSTQISTHTARQARPRTARSLASQDVRK